MPASGECGLNLSALEAAVIAGQADPRDQVVAEALARRGQLGQPLRGRHGVAAVGPAVGAEFVRHERADGQCHQHAGLALIRTQGLAAVRAVGGFGSEIKARRGAVQGVATGHSQRAPARLQGLGAAQRQQGIGPPFLTTSARSKRSKTACTRACEMGGEWPCRRRAKAGGGVPGWRNNASNTAIVTSGGQLAALAAQRSWRACSWRPPSWRSAAR